MDRIGRYEIRSELGRGGFGVVYRAHDPVMQREVAIKVLTALDDPSMLDRFRREAGTTGKLQHKNIVTVYDYGEHDGRPFFVMELLEGTTLKALIDGKVPLSLYRRVYIMTQIAEALQYAHQKQVIHRDIKPANIVLLADGTVKIVDFGIARIMDTARTRFTVPGLLIGTVEYMAPEQLHGKDADQRAEVFSYGVVLYETMSGVNPFRGGHFTEVMQLLASADAKPLASVMEDCPEAVDALTARCLIKNPEDRVQSMQEVLDELMPVYVELRRQRSVSLAAEVRKRIEEGQFAEAETALHSLLDFDRQNPEAHELRRRLEREKREAAARERASKLETNARETLASGKIQQAVPIVTELAGLQPNNTVYGDLFRQTTDLAEIHNRLQSLREKLSDTAVHELETACGTAANAAANPNMSDSLPQLLTALRRRLEVREREATEAPKEQKLDAELAEAVALMQNGKSQDARPIVERLLAQQPDHAGARRLLDQITAAEATVRRERAIVGKLAGADQLLHRRQFDQAIESLKAAITEFGEETRLRNALENAVAAKRRDQAITRMATTDGEETLDMDPKRPVPAPAASPAVAEPAPAPPTPLPEVPAPKKGRSAVRALLAIVLLAAGVTAGYEMWTRGRKTEPAPAPESRSKVLLEVPPGGTPEQTAAAAAIDQFLHAVSAGDAEAVKAVWPAAPPGTVEAWGSLLSSAPLKLAALPEVSGRTARTALEAGGKKYAFTLRKRGEDWTISSVR